MRAGPSSRFAVCRPLSRIVMCTMPERTHRLAEIFSRVASCPLRCNGIKNDPDRGVIPRSFFCLVPPEDVELLVVGKNPANTPPWEARLYQGRKPEQRATAHIEVVKDLFWGVRGVDSSFHLNLIRRVAGILDVDPSPESVFKRVALSALVKCESSGDKTDALPMDTISTCVEQHFLAEVKTYQPAYLLALGNEVHRYLTRPEVLARHRLPVGKLYHPSWSNMKGGEAMYFATEIPRLRAEFQRARRST